MWTQIVQQYKKTFRGMQIAIGLVTLGSLVMTHRLYIAAAFFLAMECGAVFGAAWGTRLKTLFERSRDGSLPARRI
jgi:membrane-associated phospholipid phosphatase